MLVLYLGCLQQLQCVTRVQLAAQMQSILIWYRLQDNPLGDGAPIPLGRFSAKTLCQSERIGSCLGGVSRTGGAPWIRHRKKTNDIERKSVHRRE